MIDHLDLTAAWLELVGTAPASPVAILARAKQARLDPARYPATNYFLALYGKFTVYRLEWHLRANRNILLINQCRKLVELPDGTWRLRLVPKKA